MLYMSHCTLSIHYMSYDNRLRITRKLPQNDNVCHLEKNYGVLSSFNDVVAGPCSWQGVSRGSVAIKGTIQRVAHAHCVFRILPNTAVMLVPYTTACARAQARARTTTTRSPAGEAAIILGIHHSPSVSPRLPIERHVTRSSSSCPPSSVTGGRLSFASGTQHLACRA